jgi:hypothetical protein
MASRKIWCTDTHGRTSQYLRCLSTISGGGYICYGRQFTGLTSILLLLLLLLFSLYSIGGGHLFFVVLSLLCCVVYSALGCLCFIAFYRVVLKSVPSSGRFLVIRVNIIHGRRRWEQHIFKREWFMIFTYYYSNEDIFQPTFYPQSSSLYTWLTFFAKLLSRPPCRYLFSWIEHFLIYTSFYVYAHWPVNCAFICSLGPPLSIST